MEKIKVSIAVPIYGVEEYIEKCTLSLMQQTYPNIEYIFVNDASKDNSIKILLSIIQKYPSRWSSIKLINHKNNCGLGITRNDAISHCTGDFILNVDSDDWLELDAVEKLVERQQSSSADIVWGATVLNEDTTDERFSPPIEKEKKEILVDILSQQWRHEIWGKLIRRSLYFQNRIKVEYGCNYCEDWQVLPRLLYYANKIEFVEDPVSHYRVNNGSMTRSVVSMEQENMRKFEELLSLSVLYNFFREKESYYHEAITNLYLDRLVVTQVSSVEKKNKCFFYKVNSLLKGIDKDDKKKMGRYIFLTQHYIIFRIYNRIVNILNRF